jgi:hypothetical protein
LNEISITFRDGKILIALEALNLASIEEEVRSAFEDISLLFINLLKTELAWKDLSDEEQEEKIQAHLAMSMKTRGYSAIAAEQARGHRDVIEGKASIGQHGFPEFEKGSPFDD